MFGFVLLKQKCSISNYISKPVLAVCLSSWKQLLDLTWTAAEWNLISYLYFTAVFDVTDSGKHFQFNQSFCKAPCNRKLHLTLKELQKQSCPSHCGLLDHGWTSILRPASHAVCDELCRCKMLGVLTQQAVLWQLKGDLQQFVLDSSKYCGGGWILASKVNQGCCGIIKNMINS